jgi:ubiquinone/menaquinone biosynthesis C-methylase UbiE
MRTSTLLLGTVVTALGTVVLMRGREIVDRAMDVMTRRPSGPIGRWIYRDASAFHGASWRSAHETLDLERSDRLLDVGCGGGTFLSQALETVETAAGLDYSPDMVELTRRNNADAVADGRLEVRLGDAAALPWPDGSFDVVTNLSAFNAMDEPVPVLSEAYRVLEPGGRLMIVTMAKPDDDNGSRFMRWLMPWVRLYSDQELSDLLRRAGFETVEVHSPDGEFQVALGVR